ncbi:MAG: macro domain-containing protein [Planctomycetaceae bacterium]
MLVKISTCELQLIVGDIAQQQADAIVNAANPMLAGGSGVDGAIHAAGGPEIMQDTQSRYPDGCPVGSAVASVPGRLSAKHLFHAVGPVWRGGQFDEPALLVSAYRSCLKLAVERDCHSIAFPAISAGAYGYPLDLAANVAIKACTDFQKWHKCPRHVRFVLFSEGVYGAFARAVEEQIELP